MALSPSRSSMNNRISLKPWCIWHMQAFPEVGMALGPILEEHGLQAYFCGHEHNLQYLHREGESTHHIVSGGGSQTGEYGNSTGQDLMLFHPGSGEQCIKLAQIDAIWQYFSGNFIHLPAAIFCSQDDEMEGAWPHASSKLLVPLSNPLPCFHAGFVQCLLNPKRLRVDFMSIDQADSIFRTYIDVAQS